MKLLRRIAYWINHRKYDAELAEEIEFHRVMSQGPIGNTTLAREDARAVWIWPWLESVVQDLRYAVRNLGRQPGFTAVALLTLGAAIGLNTSLFTVYDALALRMWTVKDPGRVVKVLAKEPRIARLHGFSIPEYRYFAEHARSVAGLAANNDGPVHLGFEGFARGSYGIFVSANYFHLLGVPMELGRGFRSDEDLLDSPENVAILSYALWRDHFGSDREIVGQRIPIDDIPFIIVGVAPENFSGTNPGREDLWMPLAAMQSLRPHEAVTRQFLRSPFDCCSNVVARLAPGFSREQAEAELAVLSRQFRVPLDIEPSELKLFEPTILAGFNKRKEIVPVLGTMFAGVMLVLLLACANVSNLLLARAAARQREIEVRRALGASRGRIVRQLLTEGFVLALGAGALGIVLAWNLPGYLFAKMGDGGPNIKMVPDLVVMGYAILMAAIACVAFAVAPALHGTRPNPRARLPLRSVLLACQITISMMLLTGAGLFLAGVKNAKDRDPGYRIRDVAVISFELPASSYDQKRTREFFAQLSRELDTVPGLHPLGITAREPLAQSHWHVTAALPGEGGAQHDLEFQEVTAGYFEVLGIPMVAGRNFEPGDDARNAIMINQTMARQLFDAVNPLGKTIITGNTVREIVGVARDAHLTGLERFVPLFFQPFSGAQTPNLLVRADVPGALETVAGITKGIEARARGAIQATDR